MIDVESLRPLRGVGKEYEKTEGMKAMVRVRRHERTPFFLTAEDLDLVFRWKLRGQYQRQVSVRSKTSDATYRAVTEAVFRVRAADVREECTIRLKLLMALPGVGVPVASAILALSEPERYCVLDFRAWRALFGDKRRSFSITDYLRYHAEVGRLAAALGWPVQEADFALWEYDRVHGAQAEKNATDRRPSERGITMK